MRYFLHPESGCKWTQEDDEPVSDELGVEEVTREQYYANTECEETKP